MNVILVVRYMNEAREYFDRFMPHEIVTVTSPHKFQGSRLDMVWYTKSALEAPEWGVARKWLLTNFLISEEYRNNPLGRIRNVEFLKEF